MDEITLENISLFGYHGCLEEEKKVGSLFRIDLKIFLNLKKSSISDNLLDTVNYIYLYKIIKKEMFIRSNLIENLAIRIIKRIKKEINNIIKVKIKVCKISPSLGGDIDKVCVILER